VQDVEEVPRITTEDLRNRLAAGDGVIPVDVRRASWERSDRKIEGAVRLDPSRFEEDYEHLPAGASVATYCT